WSGGVSVRPAHSAGAVGWRTAATRGGPRPDRRWARWSSHCSFDELETLGTDGRMDRGDRRVQAAHEGSGVELGRWRRSTVEDRGGLWGFGKRCENWEFHCRGDLAGAVGIAFADEKKLRFSPLDQRPGDRVAPRPGGRQRGK